MRPRRNPANGPGGGSKNLEVQHFPARAAAKLLPSALAVLRLTISSDFVGACTDLGLPYESHRLQAPDRKGSTSEVQQ